MSALFERAIGDDWTDLHPRIRERYGHVADEKRTAVGRGMMANLRRGLLALPFLWLGTLDDFLFPEAGRDIQFTMFSEAFVDANGNEALFLRREFETRRPRTFVDTLRWNAERGCISDFYGRHGHLVADLYLGVDDGDLRLDLGSQWLRVADRYLPVPGILGVEGTLYDRYDDRAGRFCVTADISNPLIGSVFGYDGHFENEFQEAEGGESTGRRLGAIRLPGEGQ